jgi:hypothetical protein
MENCTVKLHSRSKSYHIIDLQEIRYELKLSKKILVELLDRTKLAHMWKFMKFL